MSDGPWHRRHWVAIDVAIAVFFVLLDTGATLAGILRTGPDEDETPSTPDLATLIAESTAVGTPADALTPAHAGNVWAPYSTALAAYGPFFYRQDWRTGWIAVAVLAVVVARPWQPSVTIISIGLLRVLVGPLLALYFGARRRLVQALTERAERAERERHLLGEQARADERARLAGEMHDVVTHRVSLMVLQAGALRMTGILRTGPDEDETPSTPDLATLIAESTAVGTPAELIEDGDPALASPVVGRTAYRIVREALTNVRKHAPGARVLVRVSYDPSRVRLEVRNTPSARPSRPLLAGTGSGLGIASLRQRIELVHGTLHAGPAADGGFCVQATLPAYVPTAEPAV